MWFWFGSKTRVRRIPNGRELEGRCPECVELARFVECEVQETMKLYEILTIDDDRSTAFRCTECGELCHLAEEAIQKPRETVDERRRRELAEKLAARREREQRRREAMQSASIDAELAALKKKLGR